MQCEVWSVECEDFASSLAEKKTVVEGRTRSGQVFLRTISHLFLGNFRRRLARVYVIHVGIDQNLSGWWFGTFFWPNSWDDDPI